MEEIKQLSDDVYEQIKNFDHDILTEEQKSLIDKLILDEELKDIYKGYGLCNKCKQPKNNWNWCRTCVFQRNFKSWTSGNDDVDKFIQETQLKAQVSSDALEWIEHDKFENIEYLAKGGFGTVFKAIWMDGPIEERDSRNNEWKRKGETKVALKCLNDSNEVAAGFLIEIETHLKVSVPGVIVKCYGITKDPETNNFMMVMEYAENGSLRQYLNINFISLTWNEKLLNLWVITAGLLNIHKKGLIHHDFHCGNILSHKFRGYTQSLITDLGLCRPANETPSQNESKKIYGVLPYVAPEVLRGKEYTQASDIYAFGIIAYEVCTGFPPYHDIPHDEFLAMKICQGLKPKSNYKVPQLILDIIQRCWDADPSKRLKAEKLQTLFNDLWIKSGKNRNDYDENSIINKQIKEVDEFNKKLPPSSTATTSSTGAISYTTHPQAIYTSKLLDFKNLPEPKNADDSEVEYSESIRMDLTKLNINSED